MVEIIQDLINAIKSSKTNAKIQGLAEDLEVRINRKHFKKSECRHLFKSMTAKEQRECLKDLYIEHAYFAELVGLPALPVVFGIEEEKCRLDARVHINETNQLVAESSPRCFHCGEPVSGSNLLCPVCMGL